MTTQQRLAQLKALKDAWWQQGHSVIMQDQDYQVGRLSELREAIHALQFELILHTPCYKLTPYLRKFW